MRALFLVMMLGACGEEDQDTATEDVVGACEGAGDARVELGAGGRTGFAAYGTDEAVSLTYDGDALGLKLEFRTEGLDARDGVNAVVRLDFGNGSTDDAIGALLFTCDDPTSWSPTFAPLSAAHEIEAENGDLDGARITVDVTLTDSGGDSVSTSFPLVIAGVAI